MAAKTQLPLFPPVRIDLFQDRESVRANRRELPGPPEFSDRYILRGQDETALRAIFSPALRQALEPLEHLTIEGADDVLFIFRGERRMKAEEFVSRIEEDKRILKLFFEGQQQSAA